MWTCAYCSRRAVAGPYVDSDGIGWMAACMDDDCLDRAWSDAHAQREAKNRFAAKNEAKNRFAANSDGK